MTDFAGTDYTPSRDRERLTTQRDKVREAALSWAGGWFTMQSLAQKIDEPAASVERQVRYLRERGYAVEKRHRSGGTFEYRVRAAFELTG